MQRVYDGCGVSMQAGLPLALLQTTASPPLHLPSLQAEEGDLLAAQFEALQASFTAILGYHRHAAF